MAVTLATSRASARVLVASMRRARRVGRYSAVGIVTVSVCVAAVAAAAAPTVTVVVADDVWKRRSRAITRSRTGPSPLPVGVCQLKVLVEAGSSAASPCQVRPSS